SRTDDDVVGSESLIPFIEPMVRSNISRRVDMQPVEAASRGIDAGSGHDGFACSSAEAEFIDGVARNPLPGDIALRRYFDETIVFQSGVRNIRAGVILVRENQCL